MRLVKLHIFIIVNESREKTKPDDRFYRSALLRSNSYSCKYTRDKLCINLQLKLLPAKYLSLSHICVMFELKLFRAFKSHTEADYFYCCSLHVVAASAACHFATHLNLSSICLWR